MARSEIPRLRQPFRVLGRMNNDTKAIVVKHAMMHVDKAIVAKVMSGEIPRLTRDHIKMSNCEICFPSKMQVGMSFTVLHCEDIAYSNLTLVRHVAGNVYECTSDFSFNPYT